MKKIIYVLSIIVITLISCKNEATLNYTKDHDKWAAMIKEKEFGGIQLIVDKAFESDFIQKYMIKGIPKFILIDPQGNIVNANAPRPSDTKLKELFDKLKI
jgi:hypothetical protein